MNQSFQPNTIRMSTHWVLYPIFILGSILFTWFTVLFWYTNQIGVAWFCFAYNFFAIYTAIVSLQRVYADKQGIIIKMPLSTFYLRWDEITEVETNPTGKSAVGNALIFHGNNKALVVYLVFMDENRKTMRQFLIQQITKRQIEMKPLNNLYPKNVNTKI